MKWAWAFIPVACGAALLNYVCGSHGFSTDTPIVFDGGYRVLIGQVPYRDFFSYVGPVMYWLQAAFFGIFGVNYAAHVALGCAMNVVGTACAAAAAWRWTRSRSAALMAAAATAVWYMPVYGGTPWYNNCAFLPLFGAAALLSWPGRSRAVAAGALAAVSFFAKQTIGAAGAVFLALHLGTGDSEERVGSFLAGWLFGLLGLTAWVGSAGWHDFARYFWVLPVESRIVPFWRPLALAPAAALFAWKALPGGARKKAFGFAAASLLLLCLLTKTHNAQYFFLPLAAVPFMRDKGARSLLCALTLTQAAAFSVSLGDMDFLPFFGLQFALASQEWRRGPRTAAFLFLIFVGLRQSLRMFWNPLKTIPIVEPAMAAALLYLAAAFRKHAVVLAAAAATQLGHTARYCLEGRMPRAAFYPPLRLVRVEPLRGLAAPEVQAGALEEAYDYARRLPQEGRPFFLYEEYYLLHAVLGQPSPQPFVDFGDGLSLERGGEDEDKLCGALRRNGVRTIIRPVPMYPNLDDPLPCLKSWLDSDFVLDRRSSYFLYYRRRT